MIFLFCLALNKYFYNENAPEIVLSLLDTLLGTSRKALSMQLNYLEIINKFTTILYFMLLSF